MFTDHCLKWSPGKRPACLRSVDNLLPSCQSVKLFKFQMNELNVLKLMFRKSCRSYVTHFPALSVMDIFLPSNLTYNIYRASSNFIKLQRGKGNRKSLVYIPLLRAYNIHICISTRNTNSFDKLPLKELLLVFFVLKLYTSHMADIQAYYPSVRVSSTPAITKKEKKRKRKINTAHDSFHWWYTEIPLNL